MTSGTCSVTGQHVSLGRGLAGPGAAGWDLRTRLRHLKWCRWHQFSSKARLLEATSSQILSRLIGEVASRFVPRVRRWTLQRKQHGTAWKIMEQQTPTRNGISYPPSPQHSLKPRAHFWGFAEASGGHRDGRLSRGQCQRPFLRWLW